MNFKQENDGTVTATFKPEEIATLVKVVKSAESERLSSLKDSSEKIIKKSDEAEQLTK